MMGYGYDYTPMMGGWGWGGLMLMAVFWILVIAGVVMFIVWLARGPRRQMMSGGHMMQMPGAGDEAMALARRRLASGEITTDEFERIRKTLEGS